MVEQGSTESDWLLVGWFMSFPHAMSVASSFERARLRVVDLEVALEAGVSGEAPDSSDAVFRR